MNRSTPLSADARRLLELGSHVEPPTAEQDERMGRALAPLFRTGRTGPTPAAGSPLGGAEQRSGSPHGPSQVTAREHERSGIRLRTAPRAPTRWLEPLRWFEPLQGLKDAKLWLTLGALAATASASFWLGRLSTPAELAPAELAATELAAAELESPLDARGAPSRVAPPAEPAAALASASWAASLLDSSDGAVSSQAPSVSHAASGARAAGQASLSDDMLPRAVLPRAILPRNSLPPSSLPPNSVPRSGPGPRRSTRTRSLGLAAEIEQLARAEAALRQGRAAHALLVLEQRSVQHLLEQAAALRAIAECELGVATASRSARDVLERWPASAFQARIARACQP